MRSWVVVLSCLLALPIAASERAKAAWQALSDGAVLIDVRTPEEFADGHLAGAQNLPYDSIADTIDSLGLEPGHQVVVYCRSGRRSGIATQVLMGMGYSVTNGGGLEEMRQAQPEQP
ncbi:rhodanese-like domain-containing protein [Ferrimonas marina]|uniref:Phage shock protein E n=1 Tax=Ferrimonas marina TaxID=299255 RepID=A0A1M5YB68_9GAMM|nr:rhodanese-like domain-containing protein [Ferrimonas marina]SHI09088.1 phage shock protein E [Ferrimonas marina]